MINSQTDRQIYIQTDEGEESESRLLKNDENPTAQVSFVFALPDLLMAVRLVLMILLKLSFE